VVRKKIADCRMRVAGCKVRIPQSTIRNGRSRLLSAMDGDSAMGTVRGGRKDEGGRMKEEKRECGMLNADCKVRNPKWSSAMDNSIRRACVRSPTGVGSYPRWVPTTAGSGLQPEPWGLSERNPVEQSQRPEIHKPLGSSCKLEPAGEEECSMRIVDCKVRDPKWSSAMDNSIRRACVRSPMGVGSYPRRVPTTAGSGL